MKKMLLVLSLSASLGATANSDKLVLTCGDVASENIEYIEVYETEQGGRVMVQESDEVGTVSFVDIDEVCLGVECSMDLPSRGSVKRVLQNRHTGWKVTTYDNGVVSHLNIDCE